MLLCQPADQRHTASFCAAEEHNTADSVGALEVGTRGRARRAQMATRCPTWVRGACWCSGSPAARWTGIPYFFVREVGFTSHSVYPIRAIYIMPDMAVAHEPTCPPCGVQARIIFVAAGGRDATAKQMKGGCDLGCEATASLDAVQRCIWHSEPPCGRTDWTDGRMAGRGQEDGCSGWRVPVGRFDGATKRASSSQCGCACAWLAASHRGMASSTDDELEGFRV